MTNCKASQNSKHCFPKFSLKFKMYTEHACVFLEHCLFRSPQMSPSKAYMTGLPTTPWLMGQSSPPAPCPAHKPRPKCPRPTLLSTPFLASGLTLSRTWWSLKQTFCHSPSTGLDRHGKRQFFTQAMFHLNLFYPEKCVNFGQS